MSKLTSEIINKPIKKMNYQKFTKLVKMYGMINNVDATITTDDARFAYIAHTNFNISVSESIELTLTLKEQ